MSSYLVIENFQGGLDTRKARLAAPAGTLTEGQDGHITPGGEFEKRKAFVALVNPSEAETDSLPPNTFGLQPVTNGLLVFGSADPTGLQFPNDADGNAIAYQRLQHPAVLAGETYSAGSHAMTAVIHSEVFGGAAFVIAEFADGNRFCYYDGSIVTDFTAGLVLAYLTGNNPKIAIAAKNLVDALSDYSAAIVGPFTTTHRAHAGTTATLTIGTHNLQIGNRVWVTGIATAGYNVTNVAITATTATTISYTTGTTLTEGTTAETGGTVQTALLDIDGALGADYTVEADNDAVAGTMGGPTNTVSAVKAVTGKEASGSFTITGGTATGVAAAAATGTVTRTATNASAGDFITIGKKKYTFRASSTVEGDVTIGASAADSLTNLQRAINHTGTPGTDYVCARPHPWVRAGNISGNNLPLTAFAGSHGNTIVLTESTALARYSVTAFSGGTGNCIGSIKVVSPTGSETELLSAAVAFTTNAEATAALVRDAIQAYTGTSGYTATVNGATVTILSDDAASPMPNGYHLQIATGGDVLVGECMFYLTQQQATFTLNTIIVDGVDLLGGAAAFSNPTAINGWATGYPAQQVDNLTEYYTELTAYINRRVGVTGIAAWSNGQYIKLAKISTRDDDEALTVYITPLAATPSAVGVVFGTPPPLSQPLTVTLPAESIIATSGGRLPFNGYQQAFAAMAHTLVPQIVGGNGLYSFEWIQEYSGQEAGNIAADVVRANGTLYASNWSFPFTIVVTPATGRAVSVVFSATDTGNFSGSPGGAPLYADFKPTKLSFHVRVRVTDSFGNKATSDVCHVQFDFQ